MSQGPNRRLFIKRLMVLGATGATVGLGGCGSRTTPVAPSTTAPIPTDASAATLPAPTATTPPAATVAVPASTAPSAATELPTAEPAANSPTAEAGSAYLAVVHGTDPAEITRRAVAAVGGIERFMQPGADVIIKPNICTAYHGPEYASTTNPQVVAALVSLCLGAGARRVRVMDFPFGGTPQASYAKSGIAEAVKTAGGEMEVMSTMKYRELDIPDGRKIKKWEVYGEILDADLLINVPIAKDHSAAGLTLGMKNLMGVVKDRNGMHARGLHQTIADLNSAVRPQLTIVDAVRILVANGPTGGNLDDVKQTDTVIASADVIAADAYAATLFGLSGNDIDYIRIGAEMGLGQIDLDAIRIEEISV